MLQSDICNYSDAYIVVKEKITVTGENNIDRRNTSVALENNAPFIGCISKINNVLIDNAGDLDIAMSMHNLIEYSKNYRKSTAVVHGIVTGMNLFIFQLIIIIATQ